MVISLYENEVLKDTLYITPDDIPQPEHTDCISVNYSKLDDSNKVVSIKRKETFTLLSFSQSSEYLNKNAIFFVSNGALAQEENIDGLQKNDIIDGNRYLFLLKGHYFDTVDDDLRGNLHLVKESDFKRQFVGNLFPEECLLVDNIKSETNTKIASLYKEFQIKKMETLANLDQLKSMFLLDEESVSKVQKTIKTSDSDEKILQTIYRADVDVAAKRDAEIKVRYQKLKTLSPEMPECVFRSIPVHHFR